MQIRRIFRSHNSCVVTLPKPTLRHLGARRGDYLTIEESTNGNSIVLTKVRTRETSNVEAKEAQAVVPAAISTR